MLAEWLLLQAQLAPHPAPVAAPGSAWVAALPAILSAVAAICTAIVWPVLIGLTLWLFRTQAAELLGAAVTVAGGATRFKIWQIEFERDVQQQVTQNAAAAMGGPLAPRALVAEAENKATERAATIPSGEVASAARVRSLLDAAPNTSLRKSMEEAIKARLFAFAQEYETTRAAMHAGPDRTRAMNAIVAKMRTVALAGDPFLEELMAGDGSPGRRLAAICILQMQPRMSAVPWLVERMRVEQPFVFFHASVALLNTVRRFGGAEKARLSEALGAALIQVQSFGEHADANTIRSLTLAQSELETGG